MTLTGAMPPSVVGTRAWMNQSQCGGSTLPVRRGSMLLKKSLVTLRLSDRGIGNVQPLLRERIFVKLSKPSEIERFFAKPVPIQTRIDRLCTRVNTFPRNRQKFPEVHVSPQFNRIVRLIKAYSAIG
jgi:hypothetical protein